MTPIQPIPAWQTALRFTTTGVLVAALFLSMWWIGRLADHVENYRQLLVDIQRDVLVIVAKVDFHRTRQRERAPAEHGRGPHYPRRRGPVGPAIHRPGADRGAATSATTSTAPADRRAAELQPGH